MTEEGQGEMLKEEKDDDETKKKKEQIKAANVRCLVANR